MPLPDRHRKLLIYGLPVDSYWKVTDFDRQTRVDPGPIGRFPVDLVQRVETGHYDRFDERGFPSRIKNGQPHHNWTTVCSYALARWEQYLLSGDETGKRQLLSTADLILESVKEHDGALALFDTNSTHMSAMNHGEAMSVLSRAAQQTGDLRYVETAVRMLPLFERSVDDGGVLGVITANGCQWFEEWTTRPLRHVLNGKIISLFGLRDLATASPASEAARLLQQGLDSVGTSLPLFDAGWWSYYWTPEDDTRYVASMMYHSYHVALLSALGQLGCGDVFTDYSRRFARYTANPANRVKALLELKKGKARVAGAAH
jgi:hypothetical protein